jgi:hypothetical protein
MWQTIRRLFATSVSRPKTDSTPDGGDVLRRTATDYLVEGHAVQQRLLNVVMLFVVFVPAAWLLTRFRDAMALLNTMIEHVIRR